MSRLDKAIVLTVAFIFVVNAPIGILWVAALKYFECPHYICTVSMIPMLVLMWWWSETIWNRLGSSPKKRRRNKRR